MDLPPEVVAQLDKLEETLDTLSGFLTPFVDATPREVDAALPPLERAKAHVALARAVHLLLELRLRLRGEAAAGEGRPLAKEAERLRRYEGKLRRAALDDEAARARPGSDLNVAAANRFISAAIPDLTQEQRRSLLQGGRGAAGAGGGAGGSGSGGQRRQRQQQQQQQQQQQGGESAKRRKGGGESALGEILAAAAGDGGADADAAAVAAAADAEVKQAPRGADKASQQEDDDWV